MVGRALLWGLLASVLMLVGIMLWAEYTSLDYLFPAPTGLGGGEGPD